MSHEHRHRATTAPANAPANATTNATTNATAAAPVPEYDVSARFAARARRIVRDVVVVSVAGGFRDSMVPAALSALDGLVAPTQGFATLAHSAGQRGLRRPRVRRLVLRATVHADARHP